MSEIRATTISNAAGTGPITMTGQYAAKAWVNFNGTSTVAIRESGNVSSIADNGTGSYTVNFTTAMVDGNYAVTGTATRFDNQQPNFIGIADSTPVTNQFQLNSMDDNGVAYDSLYACIAVFR